MAPHRLWDKIKTWWHSLHDLLKPNSKLPFMLYFLQFYSSFSYNKSYHSLSLPWLLCMLFIFLEIISTWRINTNNTTFPSQVFLNLSLPDIIGYTLDYNHKNLLNTCAIVWCCTFITEQNCMTLIRLEIPQMQKLSFFIFVLSRANTN